MAMFNSYVLNYQRVFFIENRIPPHLSLSSEVHLLVSSTQTHHHRPNKIIGKLRSNTPKNQESDGYGSKLDLQSQYVDVCCIYIYNQPQKNMLIYINRFLDKSLKWCIINQPPRMDYVTPKIYLFVPGVKQCHKPSPSHRIFFVVWLPFPVMGGLWVYGIGLPWFTHIKLYYRP